MNQKLNKIIPIIDYIEDHLDQKLDLDSIAKTSGYSKYYLHRLFHLITGLTIHDYILRRRLSKSAQYLVDSQLSILDISLIAGYESQQAFSTVFKQYYKKTPLAYRQEQKYYPLQLKFILKDEYIALTNIQSTIVFAKKEDISLWMDFLDIIIDGFPCLQKEQYLKILKTCIDQQKAFILKEKDIIIAAMIFDYQNNHIDFLGIHPLYKKEDIIMLFLQKIYDHFFLDYISITTFRNHDKADTGYRQSFLKCGFIEAENLIELSYPTQKLIYNFKGEHHHEFKSR